MKYFNIIINVTLTLIVVINSFFGVLEFISGGLYVALTTVLGALIAAILLFERHKISKNIEIVSRTRRNVVNVLAVFLSLIFIIGLLASLIL